MLNQYISLSCAVLTEHRFASRHQFLEFAGARDVIRVNVSVDDVLEVEAELLDEVGVPLRVLDDRVDEDALLGVPIRQEVGVGARLAVKQLTKELGASHGGESLDTRGAHGQMKERLGSR